MYSDETEMSIQGCLHTLFPLRMRIAHGVEKENREARHNNLGDLHLRHQTRAKPHVTMTRGVRKDHH
ncbi:MAG: hypothetical protein JWL80_466 [Parcubacteria group bacterium]|nr:hypothetical protein [Parcubacteria group bacterium]